MVAERSVMRIAPGCLALLSLMALAPSVAGARKRGISDEEAARSGFGIELLQLSVGYLAPALANATFDGEGTQNGNPAHLRFDGRTAGIVRPLLHDVGLRAATFRFRHWFMVGLQMSFQWGSLDGDAARAADALGLGSGLSGVGGGLHTGFVWSKSYFDVRADIDIGVRSYSIAIPSFDVETCHAKGGAPFPCSPTASAVQVYAQPRLLLGVHLGRWLTLGVYGGIDITGGVGGSFGGWLGLHAPFWAPDLMHLEEMR
jgi:hypothetical protein